MTSQLLGTQSNFTYIDDDTYLESVMRDRDLQFHPLKGLKGEKVHLLGKDILSSELDEWR